MYVPASLELLCAWNQVTCTITVRGISSTASPSVVTLFGPGKWQSSPCAFLRRGRDEHFKARRYWLTRKKIYFSQSHWREQCCESRHPTVPAVWGPITGAAMWRRQQRQAFIAESVSALRLPAPVRKSRSSLRPAEGSSRREGQGRPFLH